MMYFNLPKRMINITKLVCVIGVVSVAFSSCLQKDVYDPANSGDKEEEKDEYLCLILLIMYQETDIWQLSY